MTLNMRIYMIGYMYLPFLKLIPYPYTLELQRLEHLGTIKYVGDRGSSS